jgi:CMP-N-acetylneuraminic acid synthetase
MPPGASPIRPVLGVVPARGGSRRLPDKNLRTLEGKPLVVRTLETARATRGLDRFVLSSDDDRILRLAAGFGDGVALRRPAALARDESPAIEYVAHALATLEARERLRFGAVVILQPTSPMTLPEDVEATLALLLESGAESAATVVRVDHAFHPAKFKRLDGNRLVPYLEEEGGRFAFADLPAAFVRNGAVYAARRSLIDRGRVIGEDCRGHVMPRERSVDINEEIDLAYAEFLLSRTAAQPARLSRARR